MSVVIINNIRRNVSDSSKKVTVIANRTYETHANATSSVQCILPLLGLKLILAIAGTVYYVQEKCELRVAIYCMLAGYLSVLALMLNLCCAFEFCPALMTVQFAVFIYGCVIIFGNLETGDYQCEEWVFWLAFACLILSMIVFAVIASVIVCAMCCCVVLGFVAVCAAIFSDSDKDSLSMSSMSSMSPISPISSV